MLFAAIITTKQTKIKRTESQIEIQIPLSRQEKLDTNHQKENGNTITLFVRGPTRIKHPIIRTLITFPHLKLSQYFTHQNTFNSNYPNFHKLNLNTKNYISQH